MSNYVYTGLRRKFLLLITNLVFIFTPITHADWWRKICLILLHRKISNHVQNRLKLRKNVSSSAADVVVGGGGARVINYNNKPTFDGHYINPGTSFSEGKAEAATTGRS